MAEQKNVSRLSLWGRALCCGLTVSILLSMAGFSSRCDGIRDKVLRLHILANSDSDADQACKLAVRDRLLRDGAPLLQGAVNEHEAAALAVSHLDELRALAQDEVRRQGFCYDVRVEVTRCSFTTRTYGSVTLPAGEYEALKVLLGKGNGHNWWCVMFPALCVPAAEGSPELDEVLDANERAVVQDAPRFKIRLKAVEWLQSVADGLRGWFDRDRT